MTREGSGMGRARMVSVNAKPDSNGESMLMIIVFVFFTVMLAANYCLTQWHSLVHDSPPTQSYKHFISENWRSFVFKIHLIWLIQLLIREFCRLKSRARDDDPNGRSRDGGWACTAESSPRCSNCSLDDRYRPRRSSPRVHRQCRCAWESLTY